MDNSVQAMMVDPLAFLMGVIGQKSGAEPADADAFMQLLNLAAAPSPVMGMPIGEDGLPAMDNPIVARPAAAPPAPAIPLILPAELMPILGLAPQIKGAVPQIENVAPQTKDAAPQSEPLPTGKEKQVQMAAQLLLADDGMNDTVYLKIHPEPAGGPEMSFLPDTKRDAEEMILPIRLRTVEQVGDRIIADADLHSATGKDTPIRLRLELAGYQIPTREAILLETKPSTQAFLAEQNLLPDQALPPAVSGDRIDLPRVFRGLDVKSIVIERATVESEPGVVSADQAIATFAERVNRFRVPATRSGSDGIVAKVTNTAPQPSPVTLPTMPQPGPVLQETVIPPKGVASPLPDEAILIEALPKDEPESIIMDRRGHPVIADRSTSMTPESINAEAVPDSAVETTTVKFFDVDQKLEVLKRNPGQRIKIQLVPARLGKMELSVVSHRGIVTVHLALESSQARQAVERNLAQLEQRLTTAGIKVDAFQLHVTPQARWESASHLLHQNQQHGFGGQGGRGFQQGWYSPKRQYHATLPGAAFQQEMVNCLA